MPPSRACQFLDTLVIPFELRIVKQGVILLFKYLIEFDQSLSTRGSVSTEST